MADNSNCFSKWGVIYCPNPSYRCKRRWKKILQTLQTSGQPFDFVQSEGEGSVARLAAMMTQNGYRTIIIMPDSVSEERRKLIRHYGAEVKLIHDAGDIGSEPCGAYGV